MFKTFISLLSGHGSYNELTEMFIMKQKAATPSKFRPSYLYEGRSESKERFAIQRYLLIIGKKQNTQVLSHTFTYIST